MQLSRRIVDLLPRFLWNEVRRLYFYRQIRQDRFHSAEQEYWKLDRWVRPGDWVLDIGANIGRYTLRLSSLVGEHGRVIAFEPVPSSFELLSFYTASRPTANVTLFNVALSDKSQEIGVTIPPLSSVTFDTKTMAQLTAESTALRILSFPLDDLKLPQRISFVKIDTEGHELRVLHGMKRLIERDHPVFLIEENQPEVIGFLGKYGYVAEKFEGSRNVICVSKKQRKRK